MELYDVLREIGLSDGESKVYLALLKLGSVPVSELKKETQLHRTTIYDFLEKLLNKGLISSVTEGKTSRYAAGDPGMLLTMLNEKADKVREAMPDFQQLKEFHQEEIQVEVLRGVEGFKALLNDILKVGDHMVAFGVDELQFKNRFPEYVMERLFKGEEEKGMTERILTNENATFVYKVPSTTYRCIPDEFFNPTPTLVYGDRTAIVVWEPLTVIRMENGELADAYRKHFELLWSMAKPFD